MVHQGTGDVEEIAPGCWIIKLPLPFPVESVNCYLIENGSDSCLIDCGLHTTQALNHFRMALGMIGTEAERISTIVVTHHHPDHLGMAGTLQALTGARVAMSAPEWEIVNRNWYDPGGTIDGAIRKMLCQSGMPRTLVARLQAHRARLSAHIDPLKNVTCLDDGEILLVGDHRLRVILTPGHSPGHVCLFEPETGLFWIGDHLLPRITPNIGLYPLSDPNPLGSYFHSLEKVVQLPINRALPSHGEPFEDVTGRTAELKTHHRRRLETLLSFMSRRSVTPYHLSQKLFGRDLPDQARRFALAETLAHLEYLVAEGHAAKSEENGLVRYRTTVPSRRKPCLTTRAGD